VNVTYPDWFYLKIYVEPPLQNRLLLDYVYPVLDHYSRQGAIREWFFIRYSDRNEAREASKAGTDTVGDTAFNAVHQGHHLRIRLRSIPSRLNEVQEALMSDLERASIAGYCKCWCEFCYLPEVHRYGGVAGIELAHEVFHLNSQDIIALLHLYSGNADTESIIRSGDELLQNLGLDAEARAQLYFRRFQWFDSIYQFDVSDHHHLEKLYFTKHQQLDEIFDRNTAAKPFAYQLPQKSARFAHIGAAFSLLEKEGQLTVRKVDILSALHHMHCNRAGFSSFKELSTIYCMYRWLKDRSINKDFS
jgi:class I lanthipeptide synthase